MKFDVVDEDGNVLATHEKKQGETFDAVMLQEYPPEFFIVTSRFRDGYRQYHPGIRVC